MDNTTSRYEKANARQITGNKPISCSSGGSRAPNLFNSLYVNDVFEVIYDFLLPFFKSRVCLKPACGAKKEDYPLPSTSEIKGYREGDV
jgi:hypothetical protein